MDLLSFDAGYPILYTRISPKSCVCQPHRIYITETMKQKVFSMKKILMGLVLFTWGILQMLSLFTALLNLEIENMHVGGAVEDCVSFAFRVNRVKQCQSRLEKVAIYTQTDYSCLNLSHYAWIKFLKRRFLLHVSQNKSCKFPSGTLKFPATHFLLQIFRIYPLNSSSTV